jgi:hypothetical protein
VTNSQCGSWLASDDGGSGDIDVGGAGFIAGKPAPTGILARRGFRFHRITTVGVSLLAMAVGQATSMLDVPVPSRASFAPAGLGDGGYSVILSKLR